MLKDRLSNSEGSMYPNSIYFGAQCTYIREYFKAKVYTVLVHGPLGNTKSEEHAHLYAPRPLVGSIGPTVQLTAATTDLVGCHHSNRHAD